MEPVAQCSVLLGARAWPSCSAYLQDTFFPAKRVSGVAGWSRTRVACLGQVKSRPNLALPSHILLLYGDTPFFSSRTISAASSTLLASKSYRLLSSALKTINYTRGDQLSLDEALRQRVILTLKLVGCFRDTLHPITLLKCTVVVLPPSRLALPPVDGWT
jgi:hypothetical protein